MAIPLATVVAKIAKKVAIDVLTDTDKIVKVVLLGVGLPIMLLLLLFAVPGMFIVSVPSIIFGIEDSPTQQKYMAMYQEAPIDMEKKNLEWINQKKIEYAHFDEIVVSNDFTLTWQELMAIDTSLFAQDFSKSSKKHINDIAEEFMVRSVTTGQYQVPEQYQEVEYYKETEEYEKWVTHKIIIGSKVEIVGEWVTKTRIVTKSRMVTKTRMVTKYAAYISITTKSFNSVLDILDMDSTKRKIAENVYDTLLSVYNTGSSNEAVGISSEIPLFHQWDQRWGNIPYGTHGTISSSACGPTSAAMVITGLQGKITGLDKNNDSILDPGEAASYAVAHGHRVDVGTSWGYFSDIGRATGLNVREYNPSQHQQVLNELKQGHPIIASVGPGHFTSNGHFIVLVGIMPDGRIKVNDPNKQTCSDTPWDFQSVIVAEAVQFWAFDNPNRKSIAFTATAYTGAQDEGGVIARDGTHLFGKDLRDKYIAVDPNVIPLGSKVLIKVPSSKRYQKMPDGSTVDMDGYYTAVDTGSAIKGYIVDIYFGTGDGYKSLCSDSWGRETIQIYLK